MKKLKNLPKWLAIVGQSGSGKGAALDILTELCKEAKIKPLFISTGELIRQSISLKTCMVKKMQEINNQGMRQPHLIASSLWFTKMLHELKKGQPIIHDGSPRSSEEFDLMQSLVKAGYFETFKVLEVFAPDKLCKGRLIARTISDKRADLSIDGRPGEPDMDKIDTKMRWWTVGRKEIIRRAMLADAYLVVNNTSTLVELEKQIIGLFQ